MINIGVDPAKNRWSKSRSRGFSCDIHRTNVMIVFARAKRGRVVENEYEKANRRPTDPTRRPSKRGGNVTRKCQKAGFKIVRLPFSRGPRLI